MNFHTSFNPLLISPILFTTATDIFSTK